MQNTRTFFKLMALIAVTPLIIAAALPAVMQDTTPTPVFAPVDTFELTGVLESINNQQIMVNGVLVDISIADLNTPLTLGSLVRIEGSLVNGVYSARQVNQPDSRPDSNTPAGTVGEGSGSDNDDNFEFYGVVDSFDDGVLIVSGQQVEIANAEIEVALAVGQVVKLEGTIIDGVFFVREVEAPDADDDDDNDDTDDNDDRFDDLTVADDCVVTAPAGWVSYTIRGGDSVSSIAARSGSSVAELTGVNCLTNPRFIVAGTTIFVARTPASFPNQGSGGNDSSISNNSGANNFPSTGGGGNESSNSRSGGSSGGNRGNESSGSSSSSNSSSNSSS